MQMYVQYKPREYVRIDNEYNSFYYAIPGYNLIICDDYKEPILIARYIGHFKTPDELKKYRIVQYQNFCYPDEYWTQFEEYREDCEIIRDLRANILEPCKEDSYKKQYSQVFVFDKTIADFICSGFSLNETNIPVEILNTIPFYSFRVRVENSEVCFKFELGNLLLLTPDESIVINIAVYETESIYLNTLFESFIKENVQRFHKTCKELYEFSDEEAIELAEKKRCEYIHFIEKTVPLVLYISSVNAEIAEKSYKQLIPIYQKEYPEEIVRYVGVKTGYNLRKVIKSLQSQSYDVDAEHKTKRPHMRKAHFHHYWVNDKITGKKKLILKWLAPILVNGYTNEEKERYIK